MVTKKSTPRICAGGEIPRRARVAPTKPYRIKKSRTYRIRLLKDRKPVGGYNFYLVVWEVKDKENPKKWAESWEPAEALKGNEFLMKRVDQWVEGGREGDVLDFLGVDENGVPVVSAPDHSPADELSTPVEGSQGDQGSLPADESSTPDEGDQSEQGSTNKKKKYKATASGDGLCAFQAVQSACGLAGITYSIDVFSRFLEEGKQKPSDPAKGMSWKMVRAFCKKQNDAGAGIDMSVLDKNLHCTSHMGTRAITEIGLDDGVYLMCAKNPFEVVHCTALLVKNKAVRVIDDFGNRALSRCHWIDKPLYVRRFQALP